MDTSWHQPSKKLPPPDFPVMAITQRRTLTTAIYTGEADKWLYPVDPDDLENIENYDIHRAAPILWCRMSGMYKTEMVELLLKHKIDC